MPVISVSHTHHQPLVEDLICVETMHIRGNTSEGKVWGAVWAASQLNWLDSVRNTTLAERSDGVRKPPLPTIAVLLAHADPGVFLLHAARKVASHLDSWLRSSG